MDAALRDRDDALSRLGALLDRAAPGSRLPADLGEAIDMAAEPLPLWDRAAAAFRLDPPQWQAYAKALLAGGRIVAAIAAFEAYGSNAKTRPKAIRSIVRIHQSIENEARALELLEAAVEEFRHTFHYDKFLRARADQRRRSGMAEDALADFLEVSLRDPADPAGHAGMIRVLCDTRNFTAARAVFDNAATRITDPAALFALEADLVQTAGWLADLLDFCQRLAAAHLDGAATLGILNRVLSRRTLFFDRATWEALHGWFAADPAIVAALTGMAARQDGLDRAEVSLEAADAMIAAQGDAARDPKAMRRRATRIEQLIRLSRQDEAVAEARVLAAIVADWPGVPRAIAHVLEWLDVQDGDVAAAQARYWGRRAQVRPPDRRAELVQIRTVAAEPDVIVLAQVRNEAPNLPSFLGHHRALGIAKFIIVDNGSTDGTRDLLDATPDVELYTTLSSYRRAVAGSEWLDPLARRPDRAGTLTLRLDADERFIYPHCDRADIAAFWAWLRGRGYQAVRAVMVDMFPQRLAEISAAGDHIGPSRYFDADFLAEPMSTAPYVEVEGGVRSRTLDGKHQNIGKVPAIVGGGLVERIGSHRCSPAAMADVTAALLHYKFRPNFFDRAREETGRREYAKNGHEWHRYLALEGQAAEDMTGPSTRAYTGWADVAAAGLMTSSPGWDAFVAERC